ncbi:hypothetical protein CAL14_06860 [Bordetella genomosp. 9]|nr:hypothetical protein CAL14_06860 [Bordetella genomosp. 9]
MAWRPAIFRLGVQLTRPMKRGSSGRGHAAVQRLLVVLAVVAMMLARPAVATEASSAEPYSTNAITLVIGFPPGADADALARLIARHVGAALKQKIIVAYRPGAAGNIAAAYVARAQADGQTLYLAVRPNTLHKVLYPDVAYDFSRDLSPVALVATMPFVMVTGANSPIATIQDLLQRARRDPGALSCASDGMGSAPHLLCERLQQQARIGMLHVPYRGAAPALTDVMGGRIDVQIVPVAAALPHIASGRLRPLAVMSATRLPALAHVPTMEEAGVPGLSLQAWYGLVAPAGTPAPVIERLNRSTNTALRGPGLRDAMARLAYAVPAQPNTPAMFQAWIAEETARWTAVLQGGVGQPRR